MRPIKVALKIIYIGFLCLFPTPTYGNHGGFYKQTNKPPIDEMDALFRTHDIELQGAFENWQSGIKTANKKLLASLNQISKPKSLYGRLYLKMCKFIFKIGV